MTGTAVARSPRGHKVKDIMSIKGQLTSTRDFLMIGLRASARTAKNAQVEQVFQACIDLVETMTRRSADIAVTDVDLTLSVMNKAVTELDEAAAARAAVSSMQNAIGRLQGLRAELVG
jgi:hypothetical protein